MEAVARKRIEAVEQSAADIVSARLKERIIGQDAAIEAVGTAFDKAYLREPGRPVASLMLLGPTGTGKTELARSLADILAADKDNPNYIRIDCAQFVQGHEVSALVGAPPGYIGREQKPALDPEIIEQRGSVVLFDEIEKGHPKLWNYLLQIMEGEGVKLLNSGQTVNFGNCTVIMTSNVGAREIEAVATEKRIGFAAPDPSKPQQLETVAMNALKRQFAPEFINRLDAMVTFNSLTDEQLGQVLEAHVARANERYMELANIRLDMSPALRDAIVAGAELRREFNSRPVLRSYDRMVESPLSRCVTGQTVGGTIVHADYEDGEVTFYEGAPLDTPSLAYLLSFDMTDYPEIAGDEPECDDDENNKGGR